MGNTSGTYVRPGGVSLMGSGSGSLGTTSGTYFWQVWWNEAGFIGGGWSVSGEDLWGNYYSWTMKPPYTDERVIGSLQAGSGMLVAIYCKPTNPGCGTWSNIF